MELHSTERIRTYHEDGVWGDTTLLDEFSATVEKYPDRTAVVDPPNKPDLVDIAPEELTCAELDAAVDATATALRDRGIETDDVVVQLPNTWELAMLYLAPDRRRHEPPKHVSVRPDQHERCR